MKQHDRGNLQCELHVLTGRCKHFQLLRAVGVYQAESMFSRLPLLSERPVTVYKIKIPHSLSGIRTWYCRDTRMRVLNATLRPQSRTGNLHSASFVAPVYNDKSKLSQRKN
ncbi:hypothetical protein BsWGS_18683 [Bradybaena similaris]